MPNLRSITADTMLIFGLPNLERVTLPTMSRYKVEEDEPDGLELFAIATNPNLSTIILSKELNRPKFYSFKGNAIPYPQVGPYWASSGEDVSQSRLEELFYESL